MSPFNGKTGYVGARRPFPIWALVSGGEIETNSNVTTLKRVTKRAMLDIFDDVKP